MIAKPRNTAKVSASSCLSIAAILAALISPSASAQLQKQLSIYGAGSQSCGTWSTDTRFRGDRQSWVLGFVSAYNFYAPGDTAVNPPDNGAITGWMDSYCAAHPLESVVNAALALITELRQQRGLPPPKPFD
jgi:hypothetical protein